MGNMRLILRRVALRRALKRCGSPMRSASFSFAPPGPYIVPVASTDSPRSVFPVRRIFCVGRNYAEHVKEMQEMDSKVTKDTSSSSDPFFFSKHPESLVVCAPKSEVEFPPMTEELHHEVELVVAMGPSLGEGQRDIPVDRCLDHIFGYAVGVDLTRRDLQSAAKAERKPWHFGKDFDGAAVVGEILPVDAQGVNESQDEFSRMVIELHVNGGLRQRGDTASMISTVAELIASLSRYQRVKSGDLIYTGTPAGVARIGRGDRIDAYASLLDEDGEAKVLLPRCSFELS